MTEDELEEKLIELCEEYASSNNLKECHFDFGLHIYPNSINPCLCVYDGREEEPR